MVDRMRALKRLVGGVSASACAAVLLFSGIGCAPASVDPPKAEAPPSNLPPAKVDLPPLIKLEGTIPPETHADHTMRIDGLLARRDKYLGQKVLVRGYLIEKYECPKDAKTCERPHVWLADSPAGGDKKLMVVALEEERVEKLEVGEQYLMTGRFDRKSGDGFMRSEGLLLHESIEGFDDAEDEKKKRR